MWPKIRHFYSFKTLYGGWCAFLKKQNNINHWLRRKQQQNEEIDNWYICGNKNNKKMILKNVVRFKVTKTKSTLNLSVCKKKIWKSSKERKVRPRVCFRGTGNELKKVSQSERPPAECWSLLQGFVRDLDLHILFTLPLPTHKRREFLAHIAKRRKITVYMKLRSG